MKYLYLIVSALILLPYSGYTCDVGASLPYRDSIPPKSIVEYTGNRLAITGLEVVKRKGNNIRLKYNLVNTGRNNIVMLGKAAPKTLVVNFDESLEASGLMPYAELIKYQLAHEDIRIKAGQVIMNNEFKIKIKEIPGAKIKAKDQQEKIPDSYSDKKVQKYLDDKFCPDLRVSGLQVLKKSKKWVTLEFTITNEGKGPAAMLGDSKSEEDDVAVRFYLSGSPKISRGSLVLGGHFLSKGHANKHGLIAPGESYTTKVRLDFRKRTRFTPFVVMELDSYQQVKECDETNNTKDILIKL